MAVKITPSLWINGKCYTSRLVFPIKGANLLDEQLDEAYISLKFTKRKKQFLPLTPVSIIFKNTIWYNCQRSDKWEQEPLLEKRFVVAADNAVESPVGSGLYNHELYLIEETKILEMYVTDSLTFTNNLGRIYLNYSKTVEPIME